MSTNEIKNLLTTIVTPLISQPDHFQIKLTEDRRFVTYNLALDHQDIGRVIGKHGRVAQAIRTLIYGIRIDNGKRIRLNILDD